MQEGAVAGEEELHRALRATGLTSEQLAGAKGGGAGPGRRKETQFQQQPFLLLLVLDS